MSPSGHVISTNYYSFKILAPIPRLIAHTQLALTMFGKGKQKNHRFDGINYDIQSIKLISRTDSLALYS